ncbi:hypothetical protein BU24DRAFT_494824 [Aaosphaeria arxii CBS 175.79]|uniref:Zn(2)-C6 fungal-type domain-containing protein n=1 Tax=Aaosphaeria arxii CBS 175.79 TaxID=1450172 RepID=A0A6A5XKT5_9PLEO|nr:uncharacterized protein BU24DRAFT_494824 [Aaosphaeria arxii CBS 175.79]KAF2012904.1 hypothetical protein BU24DRAFT_494824 [Aaosphaeria arxii CBS 175.79]
MSQSPITSISQASKRTSQETPARCRTKRAKYASVACNECKRGKIKCIRLEDDEDCQRCSATGAPCVISQSAAQERHHPKEKDRGTSLHNTQDKTLSENVRVMQQQINVLIATVSTLSERISILPAAINAHSQSSQFADRIYCDPGLTRDDKPKQPHFVGPTRPAFSFNLAESALSRMGIVADPEGPPGISTTASSRDPTPDPAVEERSAAPKSFQDCLLSFSDDEVTRLVGIYQEEVLCCHPILVAEALARDCLQIRDLARHPYKHSTGKQKFSMKDVHMLKIVLATALTHEPQGRNESCDQLISAVEHHIGSISSGCEIEIKDIQILAMLSIYFCHIEEELFSWRAIGRAARHALEMGLHRKQSLMDQFQDPDARNAALQVFWVVYELDRRWTFGTSLSFALNDRDIDAQLPEPDKTYPYLKCMVAYGRLCSRVWDALPPYGSPSLFIPKETEDYLDFIAQNWLQSIPEDLQFRHPRLGLAPKSQPRVLHRLRTLCYLRGNYLRLLIHRHHVLTPDNIKSDMQSAQLVVDIAKDSIEVLNDLNSTSDIYARQQSIYHFYLLSGLAVMLLAVCHASSTFADPCRDAFLLAVALVKGFSRNSSSSRRLWKSIRGILPVVKALGAQGDTAGQDDHGSGRQAENTDGAVAIDPQASDYAHQNIGSKENQDGIQDLWADNGLYYNGHLSTSTPDIFNLSNDLLHLYDAFDLAGSSQALQPEARAGNSGEPGFSAWEMEISRHFQGLI